MDLLEMRFFLNGEDLGQAFEDFSQHDLFPAFSLNVRQCIRVNFGQHKFLFPPDEIDGKAFKPILAALTSKSSASQPGIPSPAATTKTAASTKPKSVARQASDSSAASDTGDDDPTGSNVSFMRQLSRLRNAANAANESLPTTTAASTTQLPIIPISASTRVVVTEETALAAEVTVHVVSSASSPNNNNHEDATSGVRYNARYDYAEQDEEDDEEEEDITEDADQLLEDAYRTRRRMRLAAAEEQARAEHVCACYSCLVIVLLIDLFVFLIDRQRRALRLSPRDVQLNG
jgi:hypothetical protein